LAEVNQSAYAIHAGFARAPRHGHIHMPAAPLRMAIWMANFHRHPSRPGTALLQLIAAILSLLLLAGAFGRGTVADEKASPEPTEQAGVGYSDAHPCESGISNTCRR
jgi:hypothetical protein